MYVNGTMLIGVGGVGSALLQPLAALLANDPDCCDIEKRKKPVLTIVDGDTYEEKNLLNQCIQVSDVGEKKAIVAGCMVAGMVDVEIWDDYLSGTAELSGWLMNHYAEQEARHKAGVHPGVVIIIVPVDNDHCRKYVYDALLAVPRVSVLVIDPSNGAGDDADCVDVVTYLRVWDYEAEDCIEPWMSPLLKYKQLQKPKGRPSHVGCGEKAASLPQLRTSNMMAATLTYDCLERFMKERGLPEGYAYNDEHGLRQVGSRLPTAAEMAGPTTADTVTDADLVRYEEKGAEFADEENA
jgi:hypothetical protein